MIGLMGFVTPGLAALMLLIIVSPISEGWDEQSSSSPPDSFGNPGRFIPLLDPASAFLAVPLYTRLRREGLLNHQLREQIFGYVLAHPGACFSQIMKELNLTNGVLAYHLSTLERERLVRSLRDGAFRRYYPCSSLTVPFEEERAVLQSINSLPGIAVAELAAEMDLPKRRLDRHLASLVQRGLVRVERRGKRSFLFATRVAG